MYRNKHTYIHTWDEVCGVNQAYSRLLTTHGHITDCKLDSVVYVGACVWVMWACLVWAERSTPDSFWVPCVWVMWACLVWAERSTPDSFWVPSHRFNSATGEQQRITQTIYTDPEPPSRLPNSLMPSAKLRSTNFPVFTSLVWPGWGSNPWGLPHAERTL